MSDTRWMRMRWAAVATGLLIVTGAFGALSLAAITDDERPRSETVAAEFAAHAIHGRQGRALVLSVAVPDCDAPDRADRVTVRESTKAVAISVRVRLPPASDEPVPCTLRQWHFDVAVTLRRPLGTRAVVHAERNHRRAVLPTTVRNAGNGRVELDCDYYVIRHPRTRTGPSPRELVERWAPEPRWNTPRIEAELYRRVGLGESTAIYEAVDDRRRRRARYEMTRIDALSWRLDRQLVCETDWREFVAARR